MASPCCVNSLARKLTAAQVAEIRDRLLSGDSQKVVAKKFKVSQSTISRIKNRILWEMNA